MVGRSVGGIIYYHNRSGSLSLSTDTTFDLSIFSPIFGFRLSTTDGAFQNPEIRRNTHRDGRADRRAVVSVVGCDRRAHERAALIQAARRSPGTLAHRDERVRIRWNVPMPVLLVLDLLLSRQIFQIVFQMIRLERFAERQLLRVSDT